MTDRKINNMNTETNKKRKEFGVKLMKIRKKAGFTRYKLAKITEMSITQIKRYEEGSNSVGVDKLIDIIEAIPNAKWAMLD